MSYSLNEIEALSKRAARGAGLSWGMSEEAAKAVRWLASHGLPAAGLFADALTQNDKVAHGDVCPVSLDGVWHARSGVLCPLSAGAALNDCAARLLADQSIEMANVSHPLLVVPFAAWAAVHIKAPVVVSWRDARFKTDGFGLWIGGAKDQIVLREPVALHCALATDVDDVVAIAGQRGEVSDLSWARLNKFAHRTYAIATEESRMRGAGAGVSDSD